MKIIKTYTCLLLIAVAFATSNSIPIQVFDNIKYISLDDLSNKTTIDYNYYESKNKYEIQLENNKIVITPNSTFMLFNSNLYNGLYPALERENDILISVNDIITLLNNNELYIMFVSTDDKYILTNLKNYNVDGVAIENKVNGSQIKISTSKYFPKKNISASISQNGWLNVTIPGALIDSVKIEDSVISKPIKKTKTFQSKESGQLSFLLTKTFNDYIVESLADQVIISLIESTKSDINIKKMKDNWLIDTIVIDPGHGGKDPGAIGKAGVKEKDVTLGIAKYLGKYIEDGLGVKVVHTRTEDVFVPLWKRTDIANNSAGKIFISIHANSVASNRQVDGFETFLLRPGRTDDAIDVAKRENSVIEFEKKTKNYKKYTNQDIILATMAQSSFMKDSEFLASAVQDELDKVLSTDNRGVKQAGFHVLIGASMPNILIEVGFLSNRKEESNLRLKRHQKKIAKAIFSAIVSYKSKYEAALIESQ